MNWLRGTGLKWELRVLWLDGPEGQPSRQAAGTRGYLGISIPYLGYVEVNLQIPGIRGYNQGILLLVTLTINYAKKVPAILVSKIINRAMGMIMEGELAKAPITWRQAHLSVVMSWLLWLPHKCARVMAALLSGWPFWSSWTHGT